MKNIAFFCSYYTSSISHWEQLKRGNPLDHSRERSRFSFHTVKEVDPFLHIDLPRSVHVRAIKLHLRDEYSDLILPFEVKVQRVSGEWQSIGRLETIEADSLFKLDEQICALRIIKSGHGYFYLSAVDVLVEEEDYASLANDFDNNDGVVLVFAPWYGLGGGLAVCASAAGAVGETGNRKFVSIVPFADLIDYPLAFSNSPEDISFVRESLGRSPAADIFSDEQRFGSEQNIALWVDSKATHGQARPLVLISRDHIHEYANEGEHHHQTLQRLYSRILPSRKVCDLVNQICIRKNLSDEVFQEALGLHIRHGNGECYRSSRDDKWGVKPPSRQQIIDAVSRALEEQPGINRLVVCSDTRAVIELLKEAFPRYEIVFISDEIQEPGAGCNHVDNVFDPNVPRRDVNRQEDDLRAFAEILSLGRCARLCGGTSYFFNAVIGFSDVAHEDVYFLDNTGRYTSVPEGAVPIFDAEGDGLDSLLDIFRCNGLLIDGIFHRRHNDQGEHQLFYFDELLCEGTLDELKKYVKTVGFERDIKDRRLY